MKTPNLLRKVKLDGEKVYKRLPVARIGERFDFTRVMHQGAPVVVHSGTFYLEYAEDGRKRRRAVGSDVREVKAALATQASVLALRAKGVQVGDAPQIQQQRPAEGKTIRAVVDAFRDSPPVKLRKTSIAKYRNALESFATLTRKTHVSQLGREDIEAFMSDQKNKQGLDTSTAVDKAVIVVTVMRKHGATIKMLAGDWPKVTERQPEVYTPELLKPLFAAMKPAEFVLYQTFLQTGMRDQEIAHLSWADFDRKRSTLRVSEKAALGFAPKNYSERTIPIPPSLVNLLEEHRKRELAAGATGDGLVFATGKHNEAQGKRGGQANRKMLLRLKRIAKRAGLNCGKCKATIGGKDVTCAGAPVCKRYGLHRFRHTYATTLLRDGVDLLSLQKLMGHKDLDSTRKYLRALEPDDLLAKVAGSSIASRFVD